MHAAAPYLVPVLLLAGCSATPVDDFAGTSASSAETAGVDAALRAEAVPTVSYDCEGLSVVARAGESAVELVVDGLTATLPRAAAASGAKYERGQDASYRLFWTKGSTARLALGSDEWLACEASVPDDLSTAPVNETGAFEARGNEPPWTLGMRDGSVVFGRGHEPDRVVASLVATSALPDGGTRHVADANGRELVVDVLPVDCTDAMSGMPYPATVTVELGGRVSRGCGGEPSSLFVGERWQVVRIGDAAAVGDARPTLEFAGDGTAFGATGCNRWSATWTLTGELLSLGRVASTRRACRGPVGDQEGRLLAALEAVRGFALRDDGTLVLRGAADDVAARRMPDALDRAVHGGPRVRRRPSSPSIDRRRLGRQPLTPPGPGRAARLHGGLARAPRRREPCFPDR